MTAWKRVMLHLGHDEGDGPDDSPDYDISTEDSMVSIECVMENGTELTVFIHQNLFRRIRHVMDMIDEWSP